MQLAFSGKRLFIKRVVALLLVLLVFCSPLVKPPTKVNAIVVPAVAGAAIVAAAMSALGIGIAAGFDTDTLATATQKIWDDLSEEVRKTIVLTEMAGATVAHFTEQALRDIYNGAVNIFPQNATTNPAYTHADAFDTRKDMIDFMTNLGISSASSIFFSTSWGEQNEFFISYTSRLEISKVSNFRYVGNYSLPSTLSGDAVLNLPYNINLKFVPHERGYDFSGGTMPNISTGFYNAAEHRLRADGYTDHSFTRDVPLSTTFVALLFDYAGKSYLLLTSTGQLAYTATLTFPSLVTDGAIPTPGQDVFNPSSDKFYADGASVMNNPVDDVINRLKNGVGEKGQVPDTPDVITVPGEVVGDKVTDQTKGANQSGTIGKDIATDADKAANDATNQNRDTTKPDDSNPAIPTPWSWLAKLIESILNLLKSIWDFLSNFLTSLLTGIKELLVTLFVPSTAIFSSLQQEFTFRFGFIEQISKLLGSLINGSFGEEPPNISITIYGVTVNIIDFFFYDKYRLLVHNIIIFCAYVVYFRRLKEKSPLYIMGG